MELKAIETEYRSRKFRSRLEARWAVFFGECGIEFDYEPEGFELPSGRYLPDFWMPKQKCWIEIKGSEPSKNEQALCSQLSAASGRDVFLFRGSIFVPGDSLAHSAPPCDMFLRGGWDQPGHWCECSTCGAMGICFDGRSDRLRCKRKWGGDCKHSSHGDKGYNYDSPRLMRAYAAAIGARFEHGQSGATK